MLDRLLPRHEAYKAAMYSRGLPTAVEAKLRGISVSEWAEMVKEVEVPSL